MSEAIVYIAGGVSTFVVFVMITTMSARDRYPNQRSDMTGSLLLAFPAIAAGVFWPLTWLICIVGAIVWLIARTTERFMSEER